MSEQGVMHRRAALPCLTERSSSTGMEPGFQTAELKQVTNSARLRHKPPPGRKTHHEGLLLVHGLETSVTEFGRGVDELQVDPLQSATARLHQQGLAQGQHPLLGSNDTPLQHQEVVGHLAIVDETTLERERARKFSILYKEHNVYSYNFINDTLAPPSGVIEFSICFQSWCSAGTIS